MILETLLKSVDNLGINENNAQDKVTEIFSEINRAKKLYEATIDEKIEEIKALCDNQTAVINKLDDLKYFLIQGLNYANK